MGFLCWTMHISWDRKQELVAGHTCSQAHSIKVHPEHALSTSTQIKLGTLMNMNPHPTQQDTSIFADPGVRFTRHHCHLRYNHMQEEG